MIIELNQPLKIDNSKNEYHHVDIEVRHTHGGINYATYKQEKDGYYIHFNPCNYRIENGYSIKEYGHLFNDYAYKIRIASGYRFSKKKLAILQEIFDNHKETILKYYENGDQTSLYSYLNELYDKYLED